MKERIIYRIGIDEAGRGPLAGPVAVGAVCLPATSDPGLFSELRDSKALSEKKREEWYAYICKEAELGHMTWAVSYSSASRIDRVGIRKSIEESVSRVLKKTGKDPDEVEVLLDGALSAPQVFSMQQTIVRGDVSESCIALASIVAKVGRDRVMKKLARTYPDYGFERHKGYGTALHRRCIKERGICPEHRKTFCSSVLSS